MDDGALYGRSVAFPPRVGEDGRLHWSDGPANIRESIQLILMTNPGERVMRPDWGAGLSQFLFEPNTVATRRLVQERITYALRRWEPRIQIELVSVEEDSADPEAALAQIQYRLVSTGQAAQIDLSVPLTGQEAR